MNRKIEMSFSGRVMLLVTKKFAQKVYFYDPAESRKSTGDSAGGESGGKTFNF